jgi:hypothetical protein
MIRLLAGLVNTFLNLPLGTLGPVFGKPRSAGSLAFPLETGEMAPGSYGAHVEVRDIAGSQVLLTRDLRNVLQLRVPAGIRGVNEITDVRWFYDAVMEPPDPRLISIGPPPPLPIPKTTGAPTGGLVSRGGWPV